MQLYIANQNYSTWSLRAWLIFAHYHLPVEIRKLQLCTPEFYTTLQAITPTGKVPALQDGDIVVWESLAILEYVNDNYLNGQAWPADKADKAKARAISCEMHSGFNALRNEMPMNCRARRHVELSDAAQQDIARIDTLWSEQMARYPGQWLFGKWSIADAMFAPVALRFKTYGIELSPGAAQYRDHVLASPTIQRWLSEASLETEIVDIDEAGTPV
ncbi:glutathione S-transferase family protein [Vibrio sp. H11]|uniref:glutathione S-transferase family protein n=1 Tax=Vibrio sp. H11 TaxID=2565928 RepID=UPI0010A64F4A|nr:glutathione S-transferase family protein [Vibrio sp. H11]